MNHIIRTSALIGFLLSLSCMTWSQAVFAPVKGAKWTYTYRFTFYSVFGRHGQGNTVIKAEYVNDTIIGSRNYKLILKNRERIDTTYQPVSVIGTTVTWDTSIRKEKAAYKFLIRQSQDTIWSLSPNNSEKLYFIYLNTPGVFIMDKFGAGGLEPDRKVVIDSILSMTFGNRNFRAWKGKSYFSYSPIIMDSEHPYDSFNLTFLDRIGPINDQMFYFAFDGHSYRGINTRYPYGLVCYEDSEVGRIKFIELDCDIKLVPVQDISKGIMLQSYFDNRNKSIEIRIEDVNINQWQLSLVNISGQVVLTSVLKDSHSSISVPHSLPGGIYFTHFLNKANGNTAVKKIFIY